MRCVFYTTATKYNQMVDLYSIDVEPPKGKVKKPTVKTDKKSLKFTVKIRQISHKKHLKSIQSPYLKKVFFMKNYPLKNYFRRKKEKKRNPFSRLRFFVQGKNKPKGVTSPYLDYTAPKVFSKLVISC